MYDTIFTYGLNGGQKEMITLGFLTIGFTAFGLSLQWNGYIEPSNLMRFFAVIMFFAFLPSWSKQVISFFINGPKRRKRKAIRKGKIVIKYEKTGDGESKKKAISEAKARHGIRQFVKAASGGIAALTFDGKLIDVIIESI